MSVCRAAEQDLAVEMEDMIDEARPSEVSVDADEEQAADETPEGQGYASVSLEGCEFLVAQMEDGRLDLRDVYVLDEEAGVFARPETTGDMPEEPAQYVQVPWREEYLGDRSNGKDAYHRDLKMFLIHDNSTEDGGMLDLERVFVLDAASRSVAKEEVVRETASDNPLDLILRIREGKLTLERTDTIPVPEAVVQAAEAGTEARRREQPEEEDYDGPQEEVDSLKDDFDSPDIPAIDFA